MHEVRPLATETMLVNNTSGDGDDENCEGSNNIYNNNMPIRIDNHR